MPSANRDWDARTYHRVSTPHRGWAKALIDRLELRGDETVCDAGCGSGAVTAMLADALPAGRIYAVDVAPSMVAHARETLAGRPVTVLAQELTELTLPEPVDAIFSSATFHWIADHDTLFRRLALALRPGGRLVAQCGGEGNIDAFRAIADDVAFTEAPFAQYFQDWTRPWHYAGADATAVRLTDAGFRDVYTWLAPAPTPIDDPKPFLTSVCLVRHLDALPPALREVFVDRVLERCTHPLVLDYVRLNIVATKSTEAVD